MGQGLVLQGRDGKALTTENILIFLVRVTRWLLVFTLWDTLQYEESISLFQAKIDLANLIGNN